MSQHLRNSKSSRRPGAKWQILNDNAVRAGVDDDDRSLYFQTKITASGRNHRSVLTITIGTADVLLVVKDIAQELPELIPKMFEILAAANIQHQKQQAEKQKKARECVDKLSPVLRHLCSKPKSQEVSDDILLVETVIDTFEGS